jgi:hypothetical protein
MYLTGYFLFQLGTYYKTKIAQGLYISAVTLS